MSIGFIKTLPKEERFLKVTKGQWKVVFDRGASEARALMSPVLTPTNIRIYSPMITERGYPAPGS